MAGIMTHPGAVVPVEKLAQNRNSNRIFLRVGLGSGFVIDIGPNISPM